MLYKGIARLLYVLAFMIFSVALSPSAFAAEEDAEFKVFTPLVRSTYIPPTLVLAQIENSDLDNSFALSWSILNEPDSLPMNLAMVIEEATNPEFSNAVAYQGAPIVTSLVSSPSWTWTPQNEVFPGTYYYRVRSSIGAYLGEWSNPQSVTVYPLFVGLKVRWDGRGYFRGYLSEDIGFHEEWHVDQLTEGDTVKLISSIWYDPDPSNIGSESVNLFYSATTGVFRSSSVPSDPEWKWGAPGFLPYTLELQNGKEVSIRGQAFSVRGPMTGYTTYGRSIQYWELVNLKKFLMHDSGTWQQYVRAGNAILRYAADGSRLLLYDSVLRHYYQDDEAEGSTIQYITQLSSSNALPGGAGLVTQTDAPVENTESDPDHSSPDPFWESVSNGPIR